MRVVILEKKVDMKYMHVNVLRNDKERYTNILKAEK